MSLWRRLFPPSQPATRPPIKLAGDRSQPFGMEVVGESHYQSALARAAKKAQRVVDSGTRRRYYVDACLVREPNNPYDENAVAVYSDGRKVGYVPADDAEDLAEQIDARFGDRALDCDAVIIGDRIFGIWLDVDPELYEVDASHADSHFVPRGGIPLTGQSSSPRLPSGSYKGRHYTDWVDEVRQLKRERRLDEAAELLRGLTAAVEGEAAATGESPPPWYYEQLAIVLRKQRDFDGEVAILERYLALPHPTFEPRAELAERLEKARTKRDRARTANR